ncbi:MAG: hypothetical protein V1646_00300 [bacterium]
MKKLVHFEQFAYVNKAIAREKQLKHFLRQWKVELIEERNPKWNDLYETIFGPEKDTARSSIGVEDDKEGAEYDKF